MDYSQYNKQQSSIFFDIINEIRRQNNVKELIFEQIAVVDDAGNIPTDVSEVRTNLEYIQQQLDSLVDYESRISVLQTQLLNETDPERQTQLQDEINRLIEEKTIWEERQAEQQQILDNLEIAGTEPVYNYINEIEYVFESVYVWGYFKTLSLKDKSVFTEYDNQLFGIIVNDYRVSNNLEAYNFGTGENSIELFFNFQKNEIAPSYDYSQEQSDLFFTILNQERVKRGGSIVEIPDGIEDTITWFFETGIKELSEFNKKVDTKLFYQIRIWTITHLVFPISSEGRYEPFVIGAFTNKDDALLAFTTLQEIDENQYYFLSELTLNKPVELYLPPEEPDWLKEMRKN